MKLKGRNKVSPEFSMSSMTDIVCLLLVFFMITANSPNALDLLLPKAKGKSTNTQNVSVSIDKVGTKRSRKPYHYFTCRRKCAY